MAERAGGVGRDHAVEPEARARRQRELIVGARYRTLLVAHVVAVDLPTGLRDVRAAAPPVTGRRRLRAPGGRRRDAARPEGPCREHELEVAMDVVGERIAARLFGLTDEHVRDGMAPAQVLREPPPGLREHVRAAGATEIDLAQEEALVEEARRRHPLQVQVRPRIVGPHEQRIAVVRDEIEHGERRPLGTAAVGGELRRSRSPPGSARPRARRCRSSSDSTGTPRGSRRRVAAPPTRASVRASRALRATDGRPAPRP